MKTLKFYLAVLSLLFYGSTFAQVQIDKQLQMTGSGTNGSITGIKQVSDSSAAVNARTIQRDSLIFATDNSSTVNVYSITLNPAISAYSTGMLIHFKANPSGAANTGVCSLNVNALGAATIKKNYNVDLAANDIKPGQVVSVMYDGANFQMLSQLGNASGGYTPGKQFFISVGQNQYFVVPAGVTTLNVKLWGGGGGNTSISSYAYYGGTGAFISGALSVTAGQTIKIIVGGAGTNGSSAVSGTLPGGFGGGGGGGADPSSNGFNGGTGGGGGGRSAIQISGVDVVTAGGGGGAGNSDNSERGGGGGGAGGATTGGNGYDGNTTTGACSGKGGSNASAGGGSTSDGGAGGSGNTGGTGGGSSFVGGGGGGGGYYAGGGGGYGDAQGSASTSGGGGGGGGASYPGSNTSDFTITSNIAGNSSYTGIPAAPDTSDTDYQSPAATSGNAGLVVISW